MDFVMILLLSPLTLLLWYVLLKLLSFGSRLDYAAASFNDLTKRVSSIEGKIAEFETKFTTLELGQTELNTRITDELDKLASKVENNTNHSTSLAAAVTVLQKKSSEQDLQLAGFITCYSTNLRENLKLRGDIECNEDKIKELSERYTLLQNQLVAVTGLIKDVRTDMVSLTSIFTPSTQKSSGQIAQKLTDKYTKNVTFGQNTEQQVRKADVTTTTTNTVVAQQEKSTPIPHRDSGGRKSRFPSGPK